MVLFYCVLAECYTLSIHQSTLLFQFLIFHWIFSCMYACMCVYECMFFAFVYVYMYAFMNVNIYLRNNIFNIVSLS